MDINAIRTFLTIVETRSFAAAAGRLFVTQSTVSSRIQVLEQGLSTRLFSRGKQGAELTPAGQRFQRHAEAMLRAWNQAKLSVSLPSTMTNLLTLAGPATLWDAVLLPALPELRSQMLTTVIRGELANPVEIGTRLLTGTLDLAVHYRPETLAGLQVWHLFDDELVLVASGSDPEAASPYIYIDWGPAFQAAHAEMWGDSLAPDMLLALGSMSLSYLLATPARAYLPTRSITQLLTDGTLREVSDAPRINQPVYAITASNPTTTTQTALRILRNSANSAGLINTFR
jgi:LysR family transcriptional regulator, flagellar master operon regulator